MVYTDQGFFYDSAVVLLELIYIKGFEMWRRVSSIYIYIYIYIIHPNAA